ncbi:MAG: SCP2 sterol-binding domain-containing protein [Proteobacteria bacterium]|nr:SCP2 sterol-binding domain-containing protein [Pseudomonadota bacterium]
MSEFWNNAEEVSTAITGMFEKTFADEAIKSKVASLNVMLAYCYSDPDITIWFDSTDGKVAYGTGEPPGKPHVKFTLSADDAHRVWSNKLNVMVSIAKRKIKLEGNATRILKLTPLLRTFALNYNEKLKEMGKESIIL